MKNKHASLIFAAFLIVFTLSFSITSSVYAVPRGCYLGEGNGANTYSPTTCPTEEVARAVAEFDTCVVVLTGGGFEERNCNALEQSASKIPASRTFNSSSTTYDDKIETDCEPPAGESLSRSNCGIINFLVIGINLLSALAGMAIVFSLMFAGYQYMTARDNAGQVQKAKQRIVWAIMALTLFIFMYALLNFLVPGGVI